MSFSKDEIQTLGIGQLSAEELDEAFEAFNGFALVFGREWLDAFFRGVQSPRFVRWIIVIWRDWRAICHLPKSDQLIVRWRLGVTEGGVITEVRVIARLVRAQVEIELFPKVRDRVPDSRFRVSSLGPWIYLEASARGLSEARSYGLQVLHRVATDAADAAPGMHGKVGILRTPSAEETERIVTWLRSRPKSGDRLEDLAEFYVDTLESSVDANNILEQRVPGPALYCSHFALHGSLEKKGSARLAITDAGAEELLKNEAAQLPATDAGVVVLDVSSVVGGCQEWVPLIQRRFQPTVHTRVSAVVLLSATLAEHGPQITGQVMLNPYAKRPIPPNALVVLEGLLKSSVAPSG